MMLISTPRLLARNALALAVAAALPAYAAADDTLTVTAAAPSADTPAADQQASLGNLGKREIRNTPYAIQTVSPRIMQLQQVKEIKQIYRYLPSVQGDGARPQSRGMQGSVVQNSLIDGLNVVSTTPYPVEQFDHIEVLNGLGGALYGPANPAGMFNLVSKRPSDLPQHTLTLGGGTDGSRKIAADLSGPLDSNDRVRYRLNLLDDEGHSYAANSRKRRQLVDLAVDANLTDQTVLETTFSYYHYYEKGLPASYALASGVAFPSASRIDKDRSGQYYAGNDDNTLTAALHLKHDFDGNWLGEVAVLRQIADRESTAVTNTFLNGSGDYKTTTSSATASRFTINSYYANLTGEAETGWLKHDIAAGMRGFVWKNYNPRNGGTTTLGQASLADPQAFAGPDYPDFTDRYHSATTTQQSFLLSDTLTFSPQWSLLLSGSQNFLTSANYAKSGRRSSASNDSGFSGSGSVMYKPVEPLTLYVTYADSLQQGDVAPSGANNAGSVLSPYRSKQVEAGSKLAVGNTLLTAALFQIDRPYAYTNSAGDYAVDGAQRNRGLELMADGDVMPDLHLFGGVTWLDPRLRDTASADTENRQIVGLPRVTASMLAIYTLPMLRGTEVHAGAHYVGRRPTDNANDNWVGSYATFDLGSSYQTTLFNTATTFRLEITNLTNRHYWTNIVPGGLNGYSGAGYASAQLGEPRMAELSMQVAF